MLLLRALLSLFQRPAIRRGDLPPPPRSNRPRDLAIGFVLGLVVLAGGFGLLYFDLTHPTEKAEAAQARLRLASTMEEPDSRPVTVSLTYVEDTSAPAVAAPAATTPDVSTEEKSGLPAAFGARREPPVAVELPKYEPLKPIVEFAPPPAWLAAPELDLPKLSPAAPVSPTAPVP